MSCTHSITVCSSCKKIIKQCRCRCIDLNKSNVYVYQMCDECKKAASTYYGDISHRQYDLSECDSGDLQGRL